MHSQNDPNARDHSPDSTHDSEAVWSPPETVYFASAPSEPEASVIHDSHATSPESMPEPIPEPPTWGNVEAPRFGFSDDNSSDQPSRLIRRTPKATALLVEDEDAAPERQDSVQQATAEVVSEVYSGEQSAFESAAEIDLLGSIIPENTPNPEVLVALPRVPIVETSNKVFAANRTDEQHRLRLLNRKIEQFPESPVNYVLRGELYAAAGDEESAASDFRTAIRLAEKLDPELDWGYVNTAYIDRAEEGLRAINGE